MPEKKKAVFSEQHTDLSTVKVPEKIQDQSTRVGNISNQLCHPWLNILLCPQIHTAPSMVKMKV